MLTSDFDFDLPPELIAQEPLPERSASRMMVVDCAAGKFSHRGVADLPEYTSAGDLLVVNDTRVIPARLLGRWADTGGAVDLLLLEELSPAVWLVYCRGAKRARAGRKMALAEGRITGEVVGREEDGRVRVRLEGKGLLADELEAGGIPPVPPYIRRAGGQDSRIGMDRARYQTIYARVPGAVAAPTAGLHFTPELFSQLEARGVRRTAVTLHVGPGTFKPVKALAVEDHRMESERYEIGEESAAQVRSTQERGGRILAVGSTTVRALETCGAAHGSVMPGSGRSTLFIHSPYSFRVVNRMVTNFHFPKSTLLMMVCAFADHRMQQSGNIAPAGRALILDAYREAVGKGYRFYSYGDCMLVL
jgi:S-adenosylmethionine:tRNA ribosyltransferase-isomerase